jgi:four helix bundle protein
VGTSGFRNLAAHERAVEFGDEVYKAVGCWESFERWTLGQQLVRAADLIGTNIAESAGRWHLPDRRRLLFVARGSLYETEHWILRAEQRVLLPSGYTNHLQETARALNGLIKRPTPG